MDSNDKGKKWTAMKTTATRMDGDCKDDGWQQWAAMGAMDGKDVDSGLQC